MKGLTKLGVLQRRDVVLDEVSSRIPVAAVLVCLRLARLVVVVSDAQRYWRHNLSTHVPVERRSSGLPWASW